MNANNIGKTLVFLHLVMSMCALTWAAAIFLQFTDFGWKEPRKELDYRIASEYDKRAAALKESLRARDLVYADAKPTQLNLRDAETRLAQNTLFYMKEMDRLRNDPEAIEVNEVGYDDGKVKLDTPGKRSGKPVLDTPAPQIQKSYAEYTKDLKKLLDEGDAVNAEVGKWVEETQKITNNLNGIDEKGKPGTGLYKLMTIETQMQNLHKAEMDYLQPIWVDTLKEAEIYKARRLRLEEALSRFRRN